MLLAGFFMQAVSASLAIAWIAAAIRGAWRVRRAARLRFEAARVPAREGHGEVAGVVEAQDAPEKDAVVVEVENRIERAPGTSARDARLAPFVVALDDGQRVAVRADTGLTLLASPHWKNSPSGWIATSTLRAGERALVRGVLQQAAGEGDYRQVVGGLEIGATSEHRVVIESSAHAKAIARENGPGLLAPALVLLGVALASYGNTLPPPARWARHISDPSVQVGTVVDTSVHGLSVALGNGRLVYVEPQRAAPFRVGDQVAVTCEVAFCGMPKVPIEPSELADPRIAERAGVSGFFVLALVVLAIRVRRRVAAAGRRRAIW